MHFHTLVLLWCYSPSRDLLHVSPRGDKYLTWLLLQMCSHFKGMVVTMFKIHNCVKFTHRCVITRHTAAQLCTV